MSSRVGDLADGLGLELLLAVFLDDAEAHLLAAGPIPDELVLAHQVLGESFEVHRALAWFAIEPLIERRHAAGVEVLAEHDSGAGIGRLGRRSQGLSRWTVLEL